LRPFSPEPYSMESEWPRGRRKDRDPKQVACTGRFTFTPVELNELDALMGTKLSDKTIVEVARTYAVAVVVTFPENFFPGRLAETEVREHFVANLPAPSDPCGMAMVGAATPLVERVNRLALVDRLADIPELAVEHVAQLKASLKRGSA
jgi:hypothetical protein